VLCVAAPAAGQAGDSHNAATWYGKSFARLDGIEISDAEWNAIREFQKNPNSVPSATVRAVLARVEPVISAARRGTRADYSDFNLDFSQGYDLLLPHLSKLSNVGRLMAADAALRLHDGDAKSAADQIASMYRMADHLSGDNVLISSLVGTAVFRGSDHIAQTALDRGALGPAESTTLRQELADLSPDDPFGVIDSLDMERAIMGDWLRDKYAEATDRASIMEDLSWEEPGAAETVAGMTLLDEKHFEAALEEMNGGMDRVIEAFSMDDPDQARLVLEQIGAEFQRGDYGALSMLMPNYAGLYERMVEAREEVAERIEQLDAVIVGAVTPGELANAAVWYLQAVEMLGAVEPSKLDQLPVVVASPLEPIEEPVKATLADASAIVDALRQGSRLPRCDFSITRTGRFRDVVPDYLPGLLNAGLLLLADTVRMLQDGEDEHAAERMAICYRMTAHLAGDEWITSALVSHAVFGATEGMTARGLKWGLNSTQHRTALFEAVSAMSRKDPFGYVAGIRGAREQVLRRLVTRGNATPQAEQLLGALDGDQLLYLLVILEERDDEAASPGLTDVLPADVIAEARSRAEQARTVLRQSGDLRAAFDGGVPRIGMVNERFATARADLRRAYFTLQLEQKGP
jgi:hypothetical protein